MELAKAKAREAHHAAAVQFDKENPKEAPPQQKKKKTDKQDQKCNNDEERGGRSNGTDHGARQEKEPHDVD